MEVWKTMPRAYEEVINGGQNKAVHSALLWPLMMFGKLSVSIMGAYALLANAAIVEMYSDQDCQISVGSRNVWDNTCATGVPGFQSFMITTAGGSDQSLTTYSPDACALAYIACVGAGSVGTCYRSYDNDGGSNALSSSTECGMA
ncbi:hypothetical protein N7474_011243 [Penicillium riverlandense]|uniref:uncharacterized protein n=1 Tax=Penicillium riverlandense TaxID=1903569 RepID=UPI002548CB60|nr:uncharacterized protein N7474_011243 [Penicillium riverlandense]KAJ5805356.1 hypothetical protein N7474_011243 [Penicillium riverlandense]